MEYELCPVVLHQYIQKLFFLWCRKIMCDIFLTRKRDLKNSVLNVLSVLFACVFVDAVSDKQNYYQISV